MPKRTCSRARIVRALDEIQKHRDIIIQYNGLDPQNFEDWFNAALTWVENISATVDVDELSFRVVEKWIEPIPGLEHARDAMKAALEHGISSPPDQPQ